MEGRGNNDDKFQGSLNADEGSEQNAPEDAQGLDLGSLLGGLMGGEQQGGMPNMQQGGQGGLDLGSLLGGLMGGEQQGGMPNMQQGGQGGLDLGSLLGGLMGGGQQGGMPGMTGTPFDGIIGGVADDLSAKTGLPKQIITMGAMFLISKLLAGGGPQPGDQQPGAQQAGGLDLGGLLGGLLGGAMPGSEPSQPQQGDEVLGKIGKQIGEGLNSPHLTASGLQQSGLAGEFSQMSGLSEDEAAQSLNQIVNALKQSGIS